MRKEIWCALTLGALLAPAVSAQTFGDVPTNHWAYTFIEELADRGITSGCGGGSFCPDAPVTRAQMAVFLIRAIRNQMHHDFVSIPGNAAQWTYPSSADVSYLTDGSVLARSTGTVYAFAPLQLPDQARIVGMRCSIRDPDPTGYVQIVLVRKDLAGTISTGGDVVVFAGTFPATNDTNFSMYSGTASPDVAIVDDANYTYYLDVRMIDVTVTGNGVTFRGCSIEMQS